MGSGELSPADLIYNEAVEHMRAGDHESALLCFDRALSEDPEHSRSQLARPRSLVQLGRLEEAVVHLKALVARHPTDARALSDLGMVYRRMQEAEGALWCFRAAARLAPDMPDLHYNLARTYWDVGRYADAADAFRRLLDLRPADVEAHHEMADLCFVLEAFDHAAHHVRECLRLAPDAPQALQWRAKLAQLERLEVGADEAGG